MQNARACSLLRNAPAILSCSFAIRSDRSASLLSNLTWVFRASAGSRPVDHGTGTPNSSSPDRHGTSPIIGCPGRWGNFTTRRHVDVAEPVGPLKERGMSKSAVSRRFVTATTAALNDLMARDLTSLEVAVLMIDGLNVADQMIVVAMVITTDGTKIPVGLVPASGGFIGSEGGSIVKRVWKYLF